MERAFSRWSESIAAASDGTMGLMAINEDARQVAEDGMAVTPDTLYVIPPDFYLAISQGKLRLTTSKSGFFTYYRDVSLFLPEAGLIAGWMMTLN